VATASRNMARVLGFSSPMEVMSGNVHGLAYSALARRRYRALSRLTKSSPISSFVAT